MKEENKLALIVAYYLSKFDSLAYNNLGYATQVEAHSDVGNRLGIKPRTIQNMRDEFDPYNDNLRKGWHQREIIPSRAEIINNFQTYSEAELRNKVQLILKPQSSLQNIFNDIEMEEIIIDERSAIEGERVERKVLSYKRNAANISACKKGDNYTCQSCGFWHENKIVECHHLQPLSMIKESIVALEQLITLCPTCHRLAHYLLKKNDKQYTDKLTLLNELKA